MPMDNPLVASPVVALLVTAVMQMLKNSQYFPWISRQTGKLNAWVSIAVALCSALAISVSFDWQPETGAFAMGFKGNVWDILHVLSHWPVQWAEQHSFYKLFIALPEAAGESRAVQRDMLQALLAIATKQGESKQGTQP